MRKHTFSASDEPSLEMRYRVALLAVEKHLMRAQTISRLDMSLEAHLAAGIGDREFAAEVRVLIITTNDCPLRFELAVIGRDVLLIADRAGKLEAHSD